MGLPERVRAPLRFIGRHELGALLSLLLLAAGIWVFVEVADEVGEGETRDVDRALLLVLREREDPADPLGPTWLEEAARDVTALGSTTVLGLLSMGVVAHLLLLGKPRAAILMAAAVGGAFLVTHLLKAAFDRARPDVVPHLAHVLTSSFPSAHSMVSAAVYLTLGSVLARLQDGLIRKAHVLLWAVLLSLLIGVSRVYVGVHWPTDVLAGWAAGAAWAALCSLAGGALQRRGAVEQPR